MEDELVSIVIPTYNRANFLTAAIDSALRQTYGNKEVIVIDDGSTDNTGEICSNYGNKIRYIYKENEGTASALNNGLKVMRGQWFKWLSSDDVLFPNAVEELVKFAKEKNVDFVYSDFILIDEHDHTVGTFIEQSYTEYLAFASKLWDLSFIGNGSSSLIHKRVFEKVGPFNENLRRSDDYDFWLRACILYGYFPQRCPKILLKYRIHQQQGSVGTSGKDARQIYIKIRERIEPMCIEMYGVDKWTTLMNDFKLHEYKPEPEPERPLWKKVAKQVLLMMPESFADSVRTIYKKTFEPNQPAQTGEWFNPLYEKNTLNAKCHFSRYEFAKRYCKEKTVLDGACGCGYGTYQLAGVSKFVVGVDRNFEALKIAREHFVASNVEYIESDLIEFLQRSSYKFDVMICTETIEHLYMEQRRNLLKLINAPLLVLSFPTSPFIATSKFHYTDITLDEVLSLLTANGFNYSIMYQYTNGIISEVHSYEARNFIITAKKEN